MSSGTASSIEEPVEMVFKNSIDSSSEEPPMETWSSLILDAPVQNPKIELYKQGLYDPGSGEICAKVIAISDSNVLRHVYYNYPALNDPGIMEALLKPDTSLRKTYPYDGQELYLDLCGAMNVIPVRGFHRGLLDEEIDLKYYGVNPVGVRAMCLSLVYNKYVRRLDLTSNYLNMDACYHLGQLLGDNFALQELVLSGCKLGPLGLKRLVDRISKRTINLLDVSRNDIGDDGFTYLANQIEKGAIIKRLNLSYNGLTGLSSKVFAGAIENNNTITHLNLSWNSMFSKATDAFLDALAKSEVLSELNFSWNALTTIRPWRKILGSKTLKVLDISNNRLSTRAARVISSKLPLASNLHTLDLSHNRITPTDALLLLETMRHRKVQLKNLYLEDVLVSKEFIKNRDEILSLDYKSDCTITHGRVLCDYTVSTRDMRDIVMKRLEYLNRPSSKHNVDILSILLQVKQERQYVEPVVIVYRLKVAGRPSFDKDLLDEMSICFPGPRNDKGDRTINLEGVMDYVSRVWPEKVVKLTPEPEVIDNKNKNKNQKKKK